jgi:arsenate reductase-like glutaredoxin family protein
MEANRIRIAETVPASRKLQEMDARALLAEASTLIVAKGKKVDRFSVSGSVLADAVGAMLGPTGNLRAPLIRAGRTVLVGFNEEVLTQALL